MFVASSTPSTTSNDAGDPFEAGPDPAEPLGEARRRREAERGHEERHPDPHARTRTGESCPGRPRRPRRDGVNAAASSGPTHGLQPAPNATPTTYGRATPVTFGSVGIRRRSRESGPRATPNNARPITMISTPPIGPDPALERRQRGAERARDRAQAREHRREPRDEDERRRDRTGRVVRVPHLPHDDPEVRGNERDDARREERRDAGAEQRNDLREHAPT